MKLNSLQGFEDGAASYSMQVKRSLLIVDDFAHVKFNEKELGKKLGNREI